MFFVHTLLNKLLKKDICISLMQRLGVILHLKNKYSYKKSQI
jgi:hypothetical protein